MTACQHCGACLHAPSPRVYLQMQRRPMAQGPSARPRPGGPAPDLATAAVGGACSSDQALTAQRRTRLPDLAPAVAKGIGTGLPDPAMMTWKNRLSGLALAVAGGTRTGTGLPDVVPAAAGETIVPDQALLAQETRLAAQTPPPRPTLRCQSPCTSPAQQFLVSIVFFTCFLSCIIYWKTATCSSAMGIACW